MQKDTLIARLLALPTELAAAERDLIESEAKKRHAAGVLQAREDTLIVTQEVSGKNESERTAKLRIHTVTERLLLDQAEQGMMLTKVALLGLRAEHSSLRAVSRLLAGAED